MLKSATPMSPFCVGPRGGLFQPADGYWWSITLKICGRLLTQALKMKFTMVLLKLWLQF